MKKTQPDAPVRFHLKEMCQYIRRYNNIQILYDIVLKTIYQVFKYYHINSENATPGFTYIFGKAAVDSCIYDSE